MATHFSIPARRIPWTEEPGRLQSKVSQRVRQDSFLSKHYNSNQGHLEMASKKITEFELNCACLTLIYIHRDTFLSFLFIAQMIGPIISVVGNLTPCFYSFLLCTLSSVQFSSVTQSCPTLCDPMNRSTPGLPVPHQLPEFTQTHVIESVMPSSHLILSPPFPPAANPSQHQNLFQ